MFKYSLLLLLCSLHYLANVKCAVIQPRIFFGSDAEISEFPFQVSFQLLHKGRFHHFCAGTILSKDWILTAAHCINFLTPETYKNLLIVAGVTKLSEAQQFGQRVNISKAFGHSQFTSGIIDKDIGFVRLETPLKFNNNVKAVKLPKENEEPSGSAFATGWGTTVSGSIPDKLQKINLDIISGEECKEIYGRTLNATTIICGKRIIGSACNGDSGGPFSNNGVLIGITSMGGPCGISPTIFTKVSHYVDIIKKHIDGVPH